LEELDVAQRAVANPLDGLDVVRLVAALQSDADLQALLVG
jgi:hypothetical protein